MVWWLRGMLASEVKKRPEWPRPSAGPSPGDGGEVRHVVGQEGRPSSAQMARRASSSSGSTHAQRRRRRRGRRLGARGDEGRVVVVQAEPQPSAWRARSQRVGPHRGHQLVHGEAGPHHPRLTAPGGTGMELDEWVALDTHGLAEQTVGQGVARLPARGDRREAISTGVGDTPGCPLRSRWRHFLAQQCHLTPLRGWCFESEFRWQSGARLSRISSASCARRRAWDRRSSW